MIIDKTMITTNLNRAFNFSLNQLNLTLKVIFYSSDASQSFVPVKSYSNVDLQKKNILKENKGKSGIYRWVNNVNGNSYIGSAINLNVRPKAKLC